MATTLIVALVGLVGAPLIAYFTVARRASGTIGTSEAGQLWEESRAIREWATHRINELNRTVAHLQSKIEVLEAEHEECQKENLKLQNHTYHLEKRIRELEKT